MQNLKEKLIELSKSIYDENRLRFAIALYDEIEALKLDDNSKIVGFCLNYDLKNEKNLKILKDNFPPEIIQNISLLERIGNVSFQSKLRNLSALRKAFIGLTDDIKIIIIKLAERLITLIFAEQNNSENLLELSEECLYFYSPIAQMLGIRRIYNQIEDITFKVLHPEDFAFLEKQIKEKEAVYNSKLTQIKNDLNKVLAENKIEARIQSRIKRPYSIYRKLVKKKVNLEAIYDLLALRIITKQTEHCYLILGLVHSKWMPVDGRFKDWITYPKPNGYRSIQTTVNSRKGDKFEIQIRTEEMHEEAEFGSSAHWAYKQGSGAVQPISWIQRLREFLDNEDYFEHPQQFFETLRYEMKRDQINVLTPKGTIISLPEGATPLDFAFSIHTELGCKTIGAKINGKFEKLKTELKSGDVISVITNPNATPSRDWLNIVKTSRAKAKILRWFKKNERALYIIQGKNTWERLKLQHRRKIQKFEDEPKLRANIAKLGFKTYDDFFFAIANGAVKCSLFLLKKLYPDAFKQTENDKIKSTNRKKDYTTPVKIEGLENIVSKLARCCNPIKGEPIVALVTKRSEIKIHSADCQYIKAENANLKKAEWLDTMSYQIARCKLFSDNYSKMFSFIVGLTDELKIRVLTLQQIPNLKNNAGLYVEIEVKDIAQFDRFKDRVNSSNIVESFKQV